MDSRNLFVAASLGALSATVALAFGRVFDGDAYVAPLLAAAVLPHLIGVAARVRRWSPVVAACVVTAGLVVFAFVILSGGSPTTLADRLSGGWRIVQDDVVPLRTTDGTILLAVVIVWTAAALADDLAFRHHASLGALAPGAMVLIWITALGDRDGQWLTVGSFGITGILFLAIQHQVLLGRRRTRLGPSRPLDAPRLVVAALAVGTLAILVGVAAAPALPGGDTPLFESGGLGRDGRGQTYSTEIPPLLDVGDKLRQGAERELFTVGAAGPEYWRITALDEYLSRAGGQWTLEARGEDAVGEGLDEAVPDDALRQDYAIGELGERWMPAAYRPVRVSRSETLVVRASSTLVTTERSVAGLQYQVDSALPVQTLTAEQRQRAARAAPGSLVRYTELPADFPASVRAEAARVTAGLTSSVDKAQALRDYFRDGSFAYDPGVDLGDDQAAIERFLVARRGFCVQFASAYATMARSVGLPTRIAVGFTPGRQQADGRFHVTNWDAHAWPEVWLAGLGWTHLFDPTPPSADPGGSNLPSEPPVTPPTPTPQTETAPPQTVPPPPDSETSGAPSPTTPQGQGVTVDRSATPDDDDSSSDAPWIVLFLLVLAGIVATPVLAVVVLKRRRRKRRRSVSDPSDAIEGAWHETLDELVDRRVRWPSSDTPRELARRVPTVTSAATARPMRELAETYGAVHYGGRAASRAQADGAWRNADELRAALASSAPLRERVRARLNPSRLGRRSPRGEGRI